MANEGNKGDKRNKTIAEEVAKIVVVSAMLLLCAVAMTSLISEAMAQERKGLHCVTRWVNGRSYEFCGPSPRRPFQSAPNRTWERRSGNRLEWHAPPAIPRIGEERLEQHAPSPNPNSGARERVGLPRDGDRTRPVVQPSGRIEVPKGDVAPSGAPRPMLQTVRVIEPSSFAAGRCRLWNSCFQLDGLVDRYRTLACLRGFQSDLIPQKVCCPGRPVCKDHVLPIETARRSRSRGLPHLIENYDLETD